MEPVVSRLTVLFESPFWIGLYEREDAQQYEVCRIVFGAEPTDGEVYDFILKNWNSLRFGPAVPAEKTETRRLNPKRAQRQIRRETHPNSIGTKAQQALQLQFEQNKRERQERSRKRRELEKERQFKLRRQKHKERHRGH